MDQKFKNQNEKNCQVQRLNFTLSHYQTSLVIYDIIQKKEDIWVTKPNIPMVQKREKRKINNKKMGKWEKTGSEA